MTKSTTRPILTVMMILVCVSVSIGQSSLNTKKISIRLENRPLRYVLEEISKKTNVEFIFDDRLVDGKTVTCDVHNKTVGEALGQILPEAGIVYREVQNRRIVLYQSPPLDLRGTIFGRVTDVNSGEPLYFANVFLSNTTLGSATDKEGSYTIEYIPPGHFELVATMMGYEFEKKEIDLSDLTDVEVHFKLKPKIIKGRKVTVTAKRPKMWKEHLELFEKLFFSVNKFAKKCKIQNPEVLNLAYDEEQLDFKASAEASVLLTNEALGYEVTFLLEQFHATLYGGIRETLRQKLDRGRILEFKMVLQFKELKPKNKRQQKKWDQNRSKAYHGSKRHFFKSLFEDRLEEEGFEIYRTDRPMGKTRFKINPDRMLRRGVRPSQRFLWFEDYLTVTYKNEPDDIKWKINREQEIIYRYFYNDVRNPTGTRVIPEMRRYIGNSSHQVSWLRFKKAMPITIDANGVIIRGHENLIYSGYWYWDSPAEWLPIDYESKKSQE